MRVIFAGGRTFNDEIVADKILLHAFENEFMPEPDRLICVSGNAIGADILFARLIKQYEGKVEEYPADWNNLKESKDNPVLVKSNSYGKKYNALAGFNRNKLMAKTANKLIVVYNGSSGTKDMISTMLDLNKPVRIYDYKGNVVEHF